MSLPELTKKKVEVTLTQFCKARIPERIQNEVNLSFEFETNSVVLFENRRHWMNKSKWIKSPRAKFQFDHKNLKWTLFCRGQHQNWYLYDLVLPTHDFDTILAEVDQDPTGIFW